MPGEVGSLFPVNLSAQLNQLKGIILDLLFPPRCVGCGSEGSFLCASCCKSLCPVEPPFCERCGVPLSEGNLCLTCRRSSLEIDGIRSLFLFEGAARQAIYNFKYRNLKAVASCLGELLRDYLAANPLLGEVLVPVPLHPKRLRQRGYNQATLLSRELSKLCGLPIVEKSLLRLRDTASQTALSPQERRGNTRGAFGCADQRLHGKRVLLIDDVCTTGATLDACAVALKKGGVSSVWGLTMAREI